MVSKSRIVCIVLIALVQNFRLIAQQEGVPQEAVVNDTTVQQLEWIIDLYEHGVRVEKDTLILNPEVQQLLADDSLRAFIFPDEYTWPIALGLLERMQLKKAFWFLINLYPSNPELVMKTVITYDHLFEMDRVLISVFYTYAMVDPHVCTLQDGKPIVQHPDLVESKLNTVKEMVSYVLAYRTTEK